MKTKEPQYALALETQEKHGIARFGLMSSESWINDPRRVLFTLARYKFVAKMLSGSARVLEVGCADAFGTRLVRQEVAHVTAIDFDPVFVDDAMTRPPEPWPVELLVHDMVRAPVAGRFDAAYCLDVLEHIAPADEDAFIGNIAASLPDDGVLIVGIPSLESQAHASPQSKAGHVNCKSGEQLRHFLRRHFRNVFMFSMNDEVVHTGYFPMAHYLLALCVGPRGGRKGDPERTE